MWSGVELKIWFAFEFCFVCTPGLVYAPGLVFARWHSHLDFRLVFAPVLVFAPGFATALVFGPGWSLNFEIRTLNFF
jgi:hypothetical protein